MENGRTIDYSELPDRLWCTTGINIDHLTIYKSFGRLRNTIQHFASPEHENISQRVLEFIFQVVDPFINRSWGYFAVDHNEDTEGVIYFVPTLVNRQIEFLVSPEVVEQLEWIDFPWAGDTPYKREMQQRIEAARSGHHGASA
jgi:hypothetical protein